MVVRTEFSRLSMVLQETNTTVRNPSSQKGVGLGRRLAFDGLAQIPHFDPIKYPYIGQGHNISSRFNTERRELGHLR